MNRGKLSATMLDGRISTILEQRNDADEELVVSNLQSGASTSIYRGGGKDLEIGIKDLVIQDDSMPRMPIHSPTGETVRKDPQEKMKPIRSILRNEDSAIVRDNPKLRRRIRFALSPIFISDGEKLDKGRSDSYVESSMGSMDIFCALDDKSEDSGTLDMGESFATIPNSAAEKRKLFASNSQVFELSKEDLWNSNTSLQTL